MARTIPIRSFAFAALFASAGAIAALAGETRASAPAPGLEQRAAPSAGQTPSAPPSDPLPPKHVPWSFSGPFGTFDRAQLQRGFQVYKEVCSNCHALKHIAFRNLAEPGGPEFTAEQVAAIAAAYMVPAGPNEQGQTVDDKGQPLMRPATPADYYPPPFPNEQSARASNNGALPPDLSLIIRARAGGPDYVYSIVTGDGTPVPAGAKMRPGMNYDPYFPGRQIAMPPPLTDGVVTFSDGHPNTVADEARDVVTFLTWASEPKMEERKRMGFNVMLFLFVFTGLLYFSYRKIWRDAH